MKKLILTLYFATLCCMALAQSEINFINDDYQKALKEAATSNKVIMIDAYTTWCGPCKMMANGTFKDAETAKFYNEKFVNLKLDMEKGTNPAIGNKFNVRAYPTILYIDAKENIIFKSVGYVDGPAFLEIGQDVVSGKKNLIKLIEDYNKNKKDTAKLYALAKSMTSMQDPEASKYVAQYLKTQKDWKAEKNQELIVMNCSDVTTPMFEYFIKNKTYYTQLYGEAQITRLVENSINRFLMNSPAPATKEAKKALKLVYPLEYEKKYGQFAMIKARNEGDKKNYAKAAIEYFKKNDKDDEEMNEAGLTFYKVVENKKQLFKAIEWLQKALIIQKNNPDYMNTLAALYLKTNQILLAEKTLNASFEQTALQKLTNPFGEELRGELSKMKKSKP
jgi:thiol-disulfide isomerase/thioredoxin